MKAWSIRTYTGNRERDSETIRRAKEELVAEGYTPRRVTYLQNSIMIFAEK